MKLQSDKEQSRRLVENWLNGIRFNLVFFGWRIPTADAVDYTMNEVTFLLS